MKKILKYLSVIFYHQFKIIKTCQEAEERGLNFDYNLHGDIINHFNCRSFWFDEFGFRYRCAELFTVKERGIIIKK